MNIKDRGRMVSGEWNRRENGFDAARIGSSPWEVEFRQQPSGRWIVNHVTGGRKIQELILDGFNNNVIAILEDGKEQTAGFLNIKV